MCDTITKKNCSVPKYVYKVMQKVSDGVYITPVAGAIFHIGKWEKAKRIKVEDKNVGFFKSLMFMGNQFSPLVTPKEWGGSSRYSKNHSGRFAVYKLRKDAKNSDIRTNFQGKEKEYLRLVTVRCEVRGTIDKTRTFDGVGGYLASELKVVAEV